VRSLLFVPGDSEAKLNKALGSGADALIIDLEDSVAGEKKKEARQIASSFLNGDLDSEPKLYLRVNDFSSGETEADLDAVLRPPLSGVILPKAKSGADVSALSKLLDGVEAKAGLHPGGTSIIVIATETPQALFAMPSFADASGRLSALTWGAEDLATAIGAQSNRRDDGSYAPPFELARSLCLLGAAHAGVPAIDTVFTDFQDEDGLRMEAELAARDGFSAKLAIHPNQIEIINEAFTLDTAAVSAAQAIVAAFEAAHGAGVVSIEGRMIDRPHLRQAEQLLARARIEGLI
jgi:citrate lyase subunit beta/citryl-CoA lyase